MKKSKRNILIDTIDEYSNPGHRSVTGSYGEQKDRIGVYKDDLGNKCSVGRCMTKAALEVFGDSSKRIRVLSESGSIDHLLIEKYRGHGLEFWENIQELHDNSNYWSEDGITKKGLEYIEGVIKIDVYA